MKAQPSHDKAAASSRTAANLAGRINAETDAGDNENPLPQEQFRDNGQDTFPTEADLQLNHGVCIWTARTISFLEKVLKVNFKMHHTEGRLREGNIFFQPFRPLRDLHSAISDLQGNRHSEPIHSLF